VAAAVLIAVAYFLPWAEGWAAVGGVLVAQALASAALGTTLGRGLDPLAVESAGTWRTAVAVALGGASFVVLAFLYQISFDDSLPFPRAVVPAAAAGLLALGAVRRDQVGDGERPGMRALIVPLAALALVPVGLVLGQPNPEPAAGSGHSFRLLDYNIHSAVDEHGQLDLQGLARTISAQHPDVVVLQEVARGWIIAGTADEVEWLSVRLGMPYAWAPAADEEFGNLVLSRLPLLHAEAVPLPYGVGPQQRSYLRVALDAGKGRTLTLIATHLQDAPETSTRRNQILALLGAEGSSAPTLIVGDMNSQPTEPDIRLFTSSGLVSAQDVTGHGAESTATNPRFSGDRVDWIFGTRDLTFYAFRVVRATISDHLPLAVSVRLPTG
jgi:endonuclease/exonuclease/phosphatase family metal-dependent hydrolase